MEKFKCPKVVFKDKKLEVHIGEWFGVLCQYCDDSLYQKFLKQKILYGFSDSEIKKQFGILLSMAEIDVSETCILSDFNDKDGSFKCAFKNKSDEARMWIFYGDGHDRWPEFRIEYHDYYGIYDCVGEKNNRKLQLRTYRRKNPKKGLELWVFDDSMGYSASIRCGDVKLYIDITYSDEIEQKNEVMVSNIQMIESTLLNAAFPLNHIHMEHLYYKILRLLYEDTSVYSSLYMRSNKFDKDGLEVVLDTFGEEIEKGKSFQKVHLNNFVKNFED